MRVTVFILAVLAIHISCIYCKPSKQPGDHSPKGNKRTQRPQNENGQTRPSHSHDEILHTGSPRPHNQEPNRQTRAPGHQGEHGQTISERPHTEHTHTRPSRPTTTFP
ncbi:hypothetical protein CHS0354_042328 [Potamilus streckersoni]|uniref:Secreted protein n=1 Tax=Potamilus streckersoni TaxID=2493646 RepID=A0AAE0W1H2_9BIVA|nr:hypothetical protein CHS0354_042328 [Potamilus streckersoni]